MGYKLSLGDVDRQRLASILKLAEHCITSGIGTTVDPVFTGEDIALAQKLRKMLQDN